MRCEDGEENDQTLQVGRADAAELGGSIRDSLLRLGYLGSNFGVLRSSVRDRPRVQVDSICQTGRTEDTRMLNADERNERWLTVSISPSTSPRRLQP